MTEPSTTTAAKAAAPLGTRSDCWLPAEEGGLLAGDPEAFPATPPPSLHDPRAIAAHDWSAFEAIAEMKNHWDRPGWTDTTRAYYWMITFPGPSALADLAQRCKHDLRHLALDPIEQDGLHLTMGRIGLTSDITHRQLDGLAANAADLMGSAFTLQAVPLTASRGAIRFTVAPWHPLIAMHAALSTAGVRSGIPMGKPTSSLRPHIGIGYFNRPTPAAPVRDAIRPLRRLAAVDVLVHQVRLVELRRESRTYRWQTVHSVSFFRPITDRVMDGGA
ncbi:2'-5' RNA ligase family protein [Streptomyces sp. NBC_00885]|uniref:2'-5' RNA ligase family protein n=1 Tax=Streptomyces sp. NBC_00885 TaxID=2975857 RepID=UPI003865318B|nr:2'-5' RNA ligase family protein [Streptomyces sp. NBC_00885]